MFEPEHEQFRQSVREFIAREMSPHFQRWERQGVMDREVYREAGKHGFLGIEVPERWGGGGGNAVPVDQSGTSAVRQAFSQAVLGMPVATVVHTTGLRRGF